ncbi:Phox homologous domain-containing protein [Trichophaea hybrida]|nr:Phox homologous domain-containing protein [Trichophaea hybrida]
MNSTPDLRSTSEPTLQLNSRSPAKRVERETTGADSYDYGDGLEVLQPVPITLEDHTVTPGENSPGLWARSAQVVDYTIISGSRTSLKKGAFVSWNCVIQTFEGAQFTVRKRYASFFLLHSQLKMSFPRSAQYLPNLPPKSLISKFRPKFLESRRQGLSYFLSCILLNPEFAGSPLVKDFLLHSD